MVFRRTGGHSYGIDPYNKTDAYESDIPEEIFDAVTDFINSTDYDALYRQILKRRDSLTLEPVTEILRNTSEGAINFFHERSIAADMVHIDGNHDRHHVIGDIARYTDIMTDGSILVLDDINWKSVEDGLAYAEKNLSLIFQTATYAVLTKSADAERNQNLTDFCHALERHALRFLDLGPKPKVSVSIITFNQSRYIEEAIESVLSQKTDFDVEIVIGEDCSTDQTLAICRKYRAAYPDRIHLIERPKNIGAVPNYLETYRDCKGEYVAFLEGDDFWTDPLKLQKQVDFLDRNPDYAICFHNVFLTDDTGHLIRPIFNSLPDTTVAADLCTGDYISTPSCMIRNGQAGEIPGWMYDLPGCDWPFDILNAEHGKIKYIDEPMAAYRQHDTSIWSSVSRRDQYLMSINLGLDLDRNFGFRYHKEFSNFIERNRLALMIEVEAENRATLAQVNARLATLEAAGIGATAPRKLPRLKRLERKLRATRKAAVARVSEAAASDARKRLTRPLTLRWRRIVAGVRTLTRGTRRRLQPRLDLVIVDDAFPHPQSAFRLEEYDAYLAAFPRARVYTTGRAFSFFRDERPVSEVITEHDTGAPLLRGRTFPHRDTRDGVHARLGYTIFAGNAWENVEFFENNAIPFVFTLYPGGSFFIDDRVSDYRLRRIFGSSMFRKVIVTQKLTFDYLVERNFCPPERIEFIYGVVTPSSNLAPRSAEHISYRSGKKILDICFTAHKYTADGNDKGYDIFLDVARAMVSRFSDCHFHVVGGFQESDLPLDGLDGRITFYGGRSQPWLQEFYRDKDLILLCNVPFVIKPGAFDGFPTGCGSDAMLNEVALFCTDPLHLNREFVDGRDLVIVPHDVDTIVEKLSWYRENPEAMRELARNGREQAVRVYSFEAQIAPRLAVLRREMAAK